MANNWPSEFVSNPVPTGSHHWTFLAGAAAAAAAAAGAAGAAGAGSGAEVKEGASWRWKFRDQLIDHH